MKFPAMSCTACSREEKKQFCWPVQSCLASCKSRTKGGGKKKVCWVWFAAGSWICAPCSMSTEAVLAGVDCEVRNNR